MVISGEALIGAMRLSGGLRKAYGRND
jgi:hypothetical protein